MSRLPAGRPADSSRRFAGTGRLGRLGRIGRLVAIPLLLAALVTAGSPGWGSYTIRRGDTLEAIAARYGTTVSRLVEVNRLPGNGNLIYAGESLRVPTALRSSASRTVTVKRKHRVVAGDSLIKIARRYGVRPAVIARANHLPASLVVRLGDTLVVPVTRRVSSSAARSSANSFAGRTYASPIVRAAARNRAILANRSVPSRAAMRALIVRTAKQQDVDPALALAISWQESGFNMRSVSVANAIGAMQVIPSTGEWISSVVGRRLDLLKPRDNVLAGVVLLRVLTRSASQRNAVAGYYQGLKSVRERGMFPDTKRYVANILALKKQFGGH
jgi:LysM repeat protein